MGPSPHGTSMAGRTPRKRRFRPLRHQSAHREPWRITSRHRISVSEESGWYARLRSGSTEAQFAD
jgi:hypothetical protein